MTILIFTGILLFLTFCSGYFSSSETALFSLSSMKIKAYQSSQDPRKKLIAKLVLRPRDLLVTVFMLNTLVNILLQNVASHMFGTSAGWDLKIGVPLILTLVFGEIIPKYVGLQNNARISYYVIPTINFLQNLIEPLRKLTIAITAPISRLIFFYLKKEPNISRDELRYALKTSEQFGTLHPDEAELIRGYLQLQDVHVKEIMRPREDMLNYSLEDPLSRLTHYFVDQECARVPVCQDGIENIVGIITAKDYFLHRHEMLQPADVIPLLTKPFFVPETTLARTLLKQLDETKNVIAIVVDEYGSITGLVTREDLVEIVVGEIVDRRDQLGLYTKAGQNEIIASGKLELTDFNQLFDVHLTSPTNMVTIGGWLTEQMGTIPKSGTTFETEYFLFQVLSSEPNRIKRLYVRKLRKGIK